MTYSQKILVDIVGNRNFLQSIELLIEFVKRDLKSKYKNIMLSIPWIIFQPMFMAYFFTQIRNHISGLNPSGNMTSLLKMDYSQMYIILISWFFFATAFQRSINSIRSNNDLIFKINFPMILLPLSIVISSFADVFINIVFYLIFFFMFSGKITFNIYVFFLILFISGIFIMALCLFFSMLNCFMEEIRYVVPYITNLSLFAFPILYNENLIPSKLKEIYLNFPLVWMIVCTNDLLNGKQNLFFSYKTLNVLWISFLVFILVYLFYRKTEKYIADHL